MQCCPYVPERKRPLYVCTLDRDGRLILVDLGLLSRRTQCWLARQLRALSCSRRCNCCRPPVTIQKQNVSQKEPSSNGLNCEGFLGKAIMMFTIPN